jgi:hypothetical protein
VSVTEADTEAGNVYDLDPSFNIDGQKVSFVC